MGDELSFTQGMPIWAQWALVVTLVLLSAMFSGLTLGVLSLDKTVLAVCRNPWWSFFGDELTHLNFFFFFAVAY
jgi:hypothetical protein